MANHVHPLADLLLAELVWVAGGFGGAARPCSAAGPDFLSWGLNYIIIIIIIFQKKGERKRTMSGRATFSTARSKSGRRRRRSSLG